MPSFKFTSNSRSQDMFHTSCSARAGAAPVARSRETALARPRCERAAGRSVGRSVGTVRGVRAARSPGPPLRSAAPLARMTRSSPCLKLDRSRIHSQTALLTTVREKRGDTCFQQTKLLWCFFFWKKVATNCLVNGF